MPDHSAKARTDFVFNEHCLWFHTGVAAALAAPVGGWVQPVNGNGAGGSAEGLRRLKSLMDVCGLSARLNVCSAPPASWRQMARVHDEAYLEQFRQLSSDAGGELGMAAAFAAGGFEIAAESAGLACQAVDAVMNATARHAYAACVPAGHHAMRDQGMGGTMLGNSAIAAEHALAVHGARRVAIVDWDVHHGNGTQALFYGRADVLTVSMHQDGCFPPGSGTTQERGAGTGSGANLNVPLLPGCGHAQYLYALERLVLPELLRFQPDLVIIGCGYDAATYDVLGHMQLHSDTYRQMTRMMSELVDRLGHGRLVMVHEGGYAEAYVPFCGLAALEALSGLKSDVVDPFVDFIRQQAIPDDLDALQRRRIDDQAQQLGLESVA